MDRKSLIATLFGIAAASTICFAILSQAPVFDSSFGIILTRDASFIVSDADIMSYSASSHELTLTPECAARLEEGRYLEGAFTIVVDGESALQGRFVPPFVSRSYPSSEVVIVYPSFDMGYGVIKIQMGYPWAEPGAPELDDARIEAYFASTGRLAS